MDVVCGVLYVMSLIPRRPEMIDLEKKQQTMAKATVQIEVSPDSRAHLQGIYNRLSVQDKKLVASKLFNLVFECDRKANPDKYIDL